MHKKSLSAAVGAITILATSAFSDETTKSVVIDTGLIGDEASTAVQERLFPQASAAEVPMADCKIRRLLYLADESIYYEKPSQNFVGNFAATVGQACFNLEPTMKFPPETGCPWYIVQDQQQCPNGRTLYWMEFGITEAHSKLFPKWEYGTCGNVGKTVWIKNSDPLRTVEATIEVSSASVGTKTSMLTFFPGEKKAIGCTFVDGDARNYSIVTAVFK